MDNSDTTREPSAEPAAVTAPPQGDEKQVLLSDEECADDKDRKAKEEFDLLVLVAETMLGWSWQGTIGIKDKLYRIGDVYGDAEKELEALIWAQEAIVKYGGRDALITANPGIPPLAALAAAKQWLVKVEAGEFASAKEAMKAFQQVKEIDGIWHPLVRLFGCVCISFGFAIDIVGTWEGVAVASVVGILSGTFFLLAERGVCWALSMPFFGAFFQALPIMIMARFEKLEGSPGLLAVPALFVFIPGDSITMQAVELIEGKWEPGVARLFYSLTLLILLALGVALAAAIAGLPIEVLDPGPSSSELAFWWIYPGHVVFQFGVSFAFQMARDDIPISMVVTLITSAVSQGFTALIGEAWGTFLGAFFMTIFSCFWARKPQRPPSYVYLLTPFFTLTPGSSGLRGFESLVGGNTVEGYSDFLHLLGILLYIALGIICGFVIGRWVGWSQPNIH